jgi:hypothetical protein
MRVFFSAWVNALFALMCILVMMACIAAGFFGGLLLFDEQYKAGLLLLGSGCLAGTLFAAWAEVHE